MFRIVRLRIDGRRDDREALRKQDGMLGNLELHYVSDEKGGQTKVLQLRSSEMHAGVYHSIATLYDPEFKTFTGDQFLAKGTERVGGGREIVQEWWGRRVT